ncbi:thiol-disulfide isomerase/thioredoxin [Pullulanibacillus pueri]|uniref:Thioredoxin domain-containing protein n=1 Tax=Pullulanibacillus pueri TaxID=1437324 RepID=A0A8J2ZTL7_9BACL|nr:TlpA disulfide reductase family protein [Pullulanibacillus pueri]MBM7680341.1 thiol-disulfide isomerase/thioredoxin [Pullulanibacillus pueri]GGH75558.1 hypothetical protein GCM10007096_04910 [Pullulanibacillus pueri]
MLKKTGGASLLALCLLGLLKVAIFQEMISSSPIDFKSLHSQASDQNTILNKKSISHQSNAETQAASATSATSGKTSPLVMETLEGKKVNLSDVSGKTVFLNYFGSWCAPCKEEIPVILSYLKAHPPKNTEVLFIDAFYYEFSGKRDVQAFQASYDIPYPILLDKTKAFQKQFAIATIPTTVVLNPDGQIKSRHLGPVNEQWLAEQLP